MPRYSSSSRPTGLANGASTSSTACSPSHASTSSAPSSPPSLTHSASSAGSPTPQRRHNGNPAATFGNNAFGRLAVGQAAVQAQQLTRPSESEYLAFERDLLDPENARIAVTAVHEFLAIMDAAVTPSPTDHYDERENLQTFLIQMQLVAGIPIDHIRPMPEFDPLQNTNERVVKRRQVPAMLTIGQAGVFVPDIPPAQFSGTVDPLPTNAGLPHPTWVNRAVENFRRQRDGNATTSTTTMNTPDPQPAQNIANLNNASSNPVQNEKVFSNYFSSDDERDLISQFFVGHFSAGSGILNLESADADELFDDGTDSDYNTDYWSDTNDAL